MKDYDLRGRGAGLSGDPLDLPVSGRPANSGCQPDVKDTPASAATKTLGHGEGEHLSPPQIQAVAGIARRCVDANPNKPKPYGRRSPYGERTPETRNPPCEAGRCPGKAGESSDLAVLILPEKLNRCKSHF